MADASAQVDASGRVVVKPFGADLLGPIASQAYNATAQAQAAEAGAQAASASAVAAAASVATALVAVPSLQDQIGSTPTHSAQVPTGNPAVTGSTLNGQIWIDSTPLIAGMVSDQTVYVGSKGNGSLPLLLLSVDTAGALRIEKVILLTVTTTGTRTFVAGTDFPAGIHVNAGWLLGYDMSSGNAAATYTLDSSYSAYQMAGPAAVGNTAAKNPSPGVKVSAAGVVLAVASPLGTDVAAIKAGFYANRQRIGYPGFAVPDGNDQLPANFYGLVEPVLDDGYMTGVALYARAAGPLAVQRYRVAAGNTVFVGDPFVVTVPATGYQYVALPTPVAVSSGDNFAIKGAGIVAWSNVSAGDRADGAGVLLSTLTNGGAVPDPIFNARFHIGFDLISHSRKAATQRNTITIRSSDKILWDRNSYIDNRYGLRGKDVPQQIADLSEWRHENFSIAGQNVTSLLASIRNGDLYRACTRLQEVNPTWIVSGEMTNSYFSTTAGGGSGTLADYLSTYRQLIETSKSLGAGVILGTEHLQLFANGGPEVAPAIVWKLARDHGAEPTSLRQNANVFGPSFGGYGADYVGWNNGAHPGTRYQEIIAGAYLNLIETRIARPDESLRAFRPRPNADGIAPTIASIAALLFEPDDLLARATLFREIDHGQGGLSDVNEKYVDRIDQVTNTAVDGTGQSVIAPSEYLAWQTGRTLPFTDYAYVEAILPANGRHVESVGILVNDPTVQVYIRHALYFDPANPGYPAIASPTGRWQPLGQDADGFARLAGRNLHGAIHLDKVCFLLAKAGAFTLAEPVIEWCGTRGKVKPPLKAASRPRGAALIANPYLANGGALAAGWTGTGSPAFGTGLTSANMMARGQTADVRVTATAKVYADLTWAADQFHDREIEIEVWATGVRALVDPTAAYPGAAAITRYTCDLETLIVEVIGGSNAVPRREAVPQFWRRITYRTMMAAGSTGMRIQISAAANVIAVGFCQATFVEA